MTDFVFEADAPRPHQSETLRFVLMVVSTWPVLLAVLAWALHSKRLRRAARPCWPRWPRRCSRTFWVLLWNTCSAFRQAVSGRTATVSSAFRLQRSCRFVWSSATSSPASSSCAASGFAWNVRPVAMRTLSVILTVLPIVAYLQEISSVVNAMAAKGSKERDPHVAVRLRRRRWARGHAALKRA